MEPWHQSLSDAYALLRGQKHTVNGYDLWEKESLKDAEHPLVPYHVTEQRILHVFPEPTEALTVQGRLIGGCVDCLVNLLGTTYDKTTGFVEKYKNDGMIWFLESCDLNVMAIRRAVWQMKHAGWFSHVKAFLKMCIRDRYCNGWKEFFLCQSVGSMATELYLSLIHISSGNG